VEKLLAERIMRKQFMIVSTIFALFILNIPSRAAEPLTLIQTIPLPALHDGDFDHFAVDLTGHRLFLTVEQGAVEVFDLRTNKLIHTLKDVKEPHSLVYRADLKKLFVVDGGAAELNIFEADSYKPIGSVKLSVDCDSMAYDSASKYMYIVNGGRAAHTPYSFISVVDTTSAKKLADIKVDTNRVEALALEKLGPRFFANLTGANAVGVFDREKNTLLTTWSIAEAGLENVPLAFDEADHRLFVVTRKPSKLVILDSDAGKAVIALPLTDMDDDLAYDSASERIYAPGGEFVDVFQQDDPNRYKQVGHVPGAFRAKTAVLVPELSRYFLAAPCHGDKVAELRVYKVEP
jgi:DNA-binding beta-propeller fold protein YncE